MKSSIQITESNPFNDEIRIQCAVSEAEAQVAAAEWCDENNCLLLEIKQVDDQSSFNDTESVYSVKVSSDDYK